MGWDCSCALLFRAQLRVPLPVAFCVQLTNQLRTSVADTCSDGTRSRRSPSPTSGATSTPPATRSKRSDDTTKSDL